MTPSGLINHTHYCINSAGRTVGSPPNAISRPSIAEIDFPVLSCSIQWCKTRNSHGMHWHQIEMAGGGRRCAFHFRRSGRRISIRCSGPRSRRG